MASFKSYGIDDTPYDPNELTTNTDTDSAKIKSALDELQTPRFYETAISYYNHRENTNKYSTFSHADIIEKFYNDRAWRTNNTIAMGMDMTNAMSEGNEEQLKNFAYIQTTYSNLPSFWNDPNRNFGDWLMTSGFAMVADPVNLIGLGVGGQAAKQSYKLALKEALKGKIAKEISDKTILEAQKEAQKVALGTAMKKGALTEGMIGGGIVGAQDALMQNTAIYTGLQKDFSWKQMGLHSAAGFGFGTMFGAGFAYGGFKLTSKQLKNRSIQQLEDLHKYGRDEITGKRLFKDLSEKKEKKFYYKNLKKEDVDRIEAESKLSGKDINEQIQNLRKVSGRGKPPKETLNYDNLDVNGNTNSVKYIQALAREKFDIDDFEKISLKDMEKMAEELQLDMSPKELLKLAKSKAKEDKDLFALIIAHRDTLIKNSEDSIKLGNEMSRIHNNGGTEAEKQAIRDEFMKRRKVVLEMIEVQKQLQSNYARATVSGRVKADAQRAQELKLAPEDPKMLDLMEGDLDTYMMTVGKLDDNNHAILALQNPRKVNKWDLLSEYVNNNLLSSPDTHILNIISGLTQTQWKPFVMLLRAANLSLRDRTRASEVAKEALQTYIYQYVYTGHALSRAVKSFYMGRPLLDSNQLKYDAHIRQGQLQRWINEMGSLLTEPLGLVGKPLQKFVVNPVAFTTSLPLRVLSAGDEFLKTMLFKGRMAAQINARINRMNLNLSRPEYKAKFRELESDYIQGNRGEAVSSADIKTKSNVKISDADRLEVNDPLQYAREGSYTQSAHSVNPLTGKKEGGITGAVLSFTSRYRWTRALGLHFINTPSNLIRWNFQHLPFLGRFQFQMRHMLAKDKKTGKYLNPEAAAEANARIQAGWLIWFAAVQARLADKTTGGGDRDYKVNKEKEAATGWQPYSIKMSDGRRVSMNRLDPIFTPFAIAADVIDMIEDQLKHNEDLPSEVENSMLEASMAVVATITRNFTSKFYTKDILETANSLLSDDFMKARAPDRIYSSIAARFVYKLAPLSGGIKYINRVTQDEQKQLFTFTDRIKQIVPLSGQNSIMPQRNMFGEKVDRKNGWLFGLGGKTGLWSSPFAMTQWKDNATANFFEGREFNYRAPPKVDRKTGIDLREIRDDKGQTAYDYMREQIQYVEFEHNGKTYKLKEYVEALIADPNSDLYSFPDGTVLGKDEQQNFILKQVHVAETEAYWKMWEHFPVMEKTLEERGLFKQERFDKASNGEPSNFIDTLIKKKQAVGN